jgi:hypothetical protein
MHLKPLISAIFALLISSQAGTIKAQDSLTLEQAELYFQIAFKNVTAYSTNIDTIYWNMSEDDGDYCNASHLSIDMTMAASYITLMKLFAACFIEADREDCRDGIVITAQYLNLIGWHMKTYNHTITHEALKKQCTEAVGLIDKIIGHMNMLFPQINFPEFEDPDKG